MYMYGDVLVFILHRVSDQEAKTQTYFLETIDKFLQSDSDSLSFPTSLTGYERKIIHEVCI